jgi:cyclopropane fatty-acyl-phospholipid synthase-like methyltransferase
MLRALLRTALVGVLAVFTSSCPAKFEAPARTAAGSPEGSPRDGSAGAPVGRDRVPAPPMSYLGADWLTRPERIEEEQPDKMLDALRIRPGMMVADIGAGVGYHAFRIAERVGPDGRVFATDIQEEMLAILKKSARERGVKNVVPILAGEASTGLPAASVDLVLMVDVYHELSEPERYMAALKVALKPGARVALVEFRGEDPSVPILEEHKMTAAQVVRELSAAGFRLVERHDFLPWQHILIFAVAPP